MVIALLIRTTECKDHTHGKRLIECETGQWVRISAALDHFILLFDWFTLMHVLSLLCLRLFSGKSIRTAASSFLRAKNTVLLRAIARRGTVIMKWWVMIIDYYSRLAVMADYLWSAEIGITLLTLSANEIERIQRQLCAYSHRSSSFITSFRNYFFKRSSSHKFMSVWNTDALWNERRVLSAEFMVKKGKKSKGKSSFQTYRFVKSLSDYSTSKTNWMT